MFEVNVKQDHIHSEEPTCPPWRFLYLRKTKSWRCEEEGEGGGEEKVSLKTHTTTRGVWVKTCWRRRRRTSLGYFSWICDTDA